MRKIHCLIYCEICVYVVLNVFLLWKSPTMHCDLAVAFRFWPFSISLFSLQVLLISFVVKIFQNVCICYYYFMSSPLAFAFKHYIFEVKVIYFQSASKFISAGAFFFALSIVVCSLLLYSPDLCKNWVWPNMMLKMKMHQKIFSNFQWKIVACFLGSILFTFFHAKVANANFFSTNHTTLLVGFFFFLLYRKSNA